MSSSSSTVGHEFEEFSYHSCLAIFEETEVFWLWGKYDTAESLI